MREMITMTKEEETAETRFFRQLDEAYARVDALFGETAEARVGEAAFASLTAAAVLILRGQCIRASFTFPRAGQALLSRDKRDGLCIRRRRESAGARG